MQQSQAIKMLTIPDGFASTEQKWVDFGAGSGTFTLALAHHLYSKSKITAVDKDAPPLEKIPNHFKDISIEKRNADFMNISFSPNSLDGILMANSLHYIKDQLRFIKRTSQFLRPDGCFLIVEYNTKSANPWIPYPVDFTRLSELFKNAGFSSIQKLHEKPSRYNPYNLYSGFIRHQA